MIRFVFRKESERHNFSTSKSTDSIAHITALCQVKFNSMRGKSLSTVEWTRRQTMAAIFVNMRSKRLDW
ncbi:hypothetical protein PC116_g17369 [Phytophthora cactorum]|nr:hypothetical protein PC116_g17369 [Phytophthora cactorum]